MAYDVAAIKARLPKSELNFPIESECIQKMQEEEQQLQREKRMREEISKEKKMRQREQRERERERNQGNGNVMTYDVSFLKPIIFLRYYIISFSTIPLTYYISLFLISSTFVARYVAIKIK